MKLVCRICNYYKDITEFSNCKKNVNNYQKHFYCKPCDSERRKERYLDNRDTEIESAVKWNKNNPFSVQLIQRRWYLKNKDKVMEDQRHYRSNKRLRKYERLLGLQEIK